MARKKNSGKKTKKTTKDPKQTKKEDKLIMPKHLASEMAFYCALKVYHEHPRGLAFDSKDANGFVGLIKEELRKGGVETPEKPKKSLDF